MTQQKQKRVRTRIPKVNPFWSQAKRSSKSGSFSAPGPSFGNYSIFQLLHYSILQLVNYSITQSLNYSITALLNYSITQLLNFMNKMNQGDPFRSQAKMNSKSGPFSDPGPANCAKRLQYIKSINKCSCKSQKSRNPES